MTRAAIIERIGMRLEDEYGEGAVREPGRTTAYNRINEITAGKTFGRAKTRRSVARGPLPPYGRIVATRPGEYVMLDTQSLDIFAIQPVTCRWVPLQLTVAIDLYCRCVCGYLVTVLSTKAIDVAHVLYQVMTPQFVPPHWPDGGVWPYHGVPKTSSE